MSLKETMKAAVFVADGDLRILEVEKPEITHPNEVLIKVEGCADVYKRQVFNHILKWDASLNPKKYYYNKIENNQK